MVSALESNTKLAVFHQLNTLYQSIREDGDKTYNTWLPYLQRSSFAESAYNLAHYLALRKHDIRSLQLELMALGLSSLGRIEARVLPTLEATLASFGYLLDLPHSRPDSQTMFAGELRLKSATAEIFGCSDSAQILATLPEEVALNHKLVRRLVQAGMSATRINCAHGDHETWIPIIANIRRIEEEQGKKIPILMDLCGPRLRTEKVWGKNRKIVTGDCIVLTAVSQHLETCEFQAVVSIPSALKQLEVGQRVFIDDGKLEAKVERVTSDLAEVRVINAPPKGFKLQAEKGINFPDTHLQLQALSLKDLLDLDFAAKEADLIGYSFVQRPADIHQLIDELESRRPISIKGIVLKIETAEAVANLPQLIVHAAGRWPIAIMIARGDLAIELGYERLAEMQEEILWLAEAASVPVIWATQVLDRLVKKGTPSRAEVSDAVLAARTECVMLNKGPYLEQGILVLVDVMQRMQEHQYKKFPKMRSLRVWQ